MGDLDTSNLGFPDPHPAPQAGMPPVHRFISLIIQKASQILKNQTKFFLAVPSFLVQASQEMGEGGRRGGDAAQ